MKHSGQYFSIGRHSGEKVLERLVTKRMETEKKISHFLHTSPRSAYWRAQHANFSHLLCYFAGCTEGEDNLRELAETLNRLSTPLTRPRAPVKPRWIGAEPAEV